MSLSRSLFDERDETLDAVEESLIAVNLPGRQPLQFSEKARSCDHHGALCDPLYEGEDRPIWR